MYRTRLEKIIKRNSIYIYTHPEYYYSPIMTERANLKVRIDYRLIQFYWNKQLAYLPRAQCGAPIARQKYKVAVKWS